MDRRIGPRRMDRRAAPGLGVRPFVGLLAAALTAAGVQLLLATKERLQGVQQPVPTALAVGAGCVLGLLSGVTGIGSGIFLSPLLHALAWAPARQIAGSYSLFILVNSLAGLAGQSAKLAETSLIGVAATYWPLLASVLIGGQIGAALGATKLPERWIMGVTGVLVLYVAVRLALRSASYFR
ncbi:MAG: sulfite exporter TauE/SafE family protein [Parvularculaceae bacterium]|nr:sulfite exporter TauE/SafE family protein [Parvularculaceae bacterium]